MITLICSPLNWDSSFMPYHYLYLGNYIGNRGIQYNIFDYHPNVYCQTIKNIFTKKSMIEVVEEKILTYLREHKPPYIGLAFYTTDYNINMELCRKIKQIYNPIIIAGNVHSSVMYEDLIFEHSPVDIVIRGEGEQTLFEVLKTSKTNWKNVDGIVFFNKGKLVINKNRKLLDSSNIEPGKAYEKLDMNYYIRPTTSIIRNVLTRGVGIYTGRGCPFNCTFCCANMLWNIHGKNFLRTRKLESVINELLFLKKRYKIDSFYIMDETFTMDKERVFKFCRLLKENKVNLIWAAETRANLVTKELLSKMKNAGCVQIEFGVESGSKKCLKEINKNVKVEDVKNAFKWAKELKMRTFANMLINIPGETENDLKLNDKLLEEIQPTEIVHSITTPYPGTQMYEKYVNPKLIKEEYPLLLSEGRSSGGNRFRMCKHNLDLNMILKDITNKNRKWYQLSFISFSFMPQYLNMLLCSKFRLTYLVSFNKLFFDNIMGRLRRKFLVGK